MNESKVSHHAKISSHANISQHEAFPIYSVNDVCDRLYINRPFTTKCNFAVRAEIVHRTQFINFVFMSKMKLIHYYCTYLLVKFGTGSITKQLVVGLVVNEVQIGNLKRTFHEMYMFNYFMLTVV